MINHETPLFIRESDDEKTSDARSSWVDSLSFCLIFSLLVGILYTVVVMGPRVLNPRDIGWLTHDPVAHYVGWELFRHDPQWHWPLTFTTWLGYPVGESTALQDFNPVMALALKPFSSLLPEPFQYFGIEIVISCTLQFFFAWRLLRALVGAKTVGIVLASAFFLIAPPLTYRLHGHYSLTNHWVLIAAFLLFFRAQSFPQTSLLRFEISALLLAGLVVAINPYLAFQVLMILAAAVVSVVWQKRVSFVRALGLMILIAGVCALLAYSIGFVITGGKGYATGGYRYYSMNLLSPIDPYLTQLEPPGRGSILFPRLPQLTDGQYEGYNYLGAGVILLAVAVVMLLWINRRRLKSVDRRWVIPLFLCCLALTLMACSTRISLGSHVFVDVDPHEKLTRFFAPLRASGRLFWAPYYLIVTVVLAMPMLFLRKVCANLLLATVLVLQVADTAPLRNWVRHYVDSGYSHPLRSPIWWTLGASYKNLEVLPAWQCDNSYTPGGPQGYGIFGLLAADQKMRTNSYDSARYTEQARQLHCVQAVTDLAEKPLSADSAYVVTPALASIIAKGPTGPGKCHDLDGYILCSTASDFGLSSTLKSAAEREQDAIRDPGFEDNDLSLWLPFQDAKSSVSSEHTHTGVHSLAQTEGEGSVNQDITGLEPGKVYVVSAWVSASPGATARAQIALWSPSANVASFSPEARPIPSWQLLTHSMAAGSDGILRLHLFRKSGSGTIYWDDVTIRPRD
jgi:hypothetical protein